MKKPSIGSKKSAEQGDEDAIEVLKKLEELENNK